MMAEVAKSGALSSRNRINWMQKRQDEEKLSQILYQGHLINLEGDIYKSELKSARKANNTNFSSSNLTKSHSNVHLPPIKPVDDVQTKNFLSDLRQRDYKKYLESLKIVKHNQETKQTNDVLKDKLFRIKFKSYNSMAKEASHHQWNKLESIFKLPLDGQSSSAGVLGSSRQGQRPKPLAVQQSGAMTDRPTGQTHTGTAAAPNQLTNGGMRPTQAAGLAPTHKPQAGDSGTQQKQQAPPADEF